MNRSVIKTDADYESALEEMEALVEQNPEPGSPEADRLELLSLLVSAYEEKHAAIPLPDPVEAIRFRMEQLDLSQRDLIPFVGSRGRVSEVLSGKRPLTLRMIRALHRGLGIPAAVLLQDPRPPTPQVDEIEWERFPVREMVKRGWIQASTKSLRGRAEALMREYVKPLGGSPPTVAGAFLKRTRSARSMDPYAVHAWCLRVIRQAMERPLPAEFDENVLSAEFLTELAKLSTRADGPLRARDALTQHGIHLVVERHLPKTHLDGAALRTPLGNPIVGMTIRHDRLDNFWFCLFHELVHHWRHMSEDVEGFIDDLESSGGGDRLEEEADRRAAEALVPLRAIRGSRAEQVRTPGAVQSLAAEIGVHPALVAGRIRHDARNYRILDPLIGRGEVRRLFPECAW